MQSEKKVVRRFIEICAAKGIQYIIISPGSRNAPLNISFNNDERFTCISVPDERVAAFIALGISQQTHQPALITCTSGTAALNYAPAIAEAYYQQIPMLIVTADRPPEWTNQGNGQTINQTNVFNNYIKKSYHLPVEIHHENDEWFANRIISEAIEQTTNYGTFGPVHINMPFREPLYNLVNIEEKQPKITKTITPTFQLSQNAKSELSEIWNNSEKILVVAGLLPLNHGLNELLKQLTKTDNRVVVLSETTSNLHFENNYPYIDRLIDGFSETEKENFRPDLLITIGHSIISKKVKAYLRKHQAKSTWHIGNEQFHLDTMQGLTHHIPASPFDFFTSFININNISNNENERFKNYSKFWRQRDLKIKINHDKFLKTCQWSDMKAFEIFLKALPKETNLQMGNSSAVRYVQLFEQRKDLTYNSNRGVAGIDGCTSTAIGAAIATKKPTTIVTGDISFFYDSNAFWNSHLPENLRVILINNGGGNIFRIIKGPDTTEHLENFFETHHNLQSQHIANLFDLTYYQATNETDLEKILPKFYEQQKNNRPAILEIMTPRFENDKVLKGYFENLKKL